jgi:hypothetical protein
MSNRTSPSCLLQVVGLGLIALSFVIVILIVRLAVQAFS